MSESAPPGQVDHIATNTLIGDGKTKQANNKVPSVHGFFGLKTGVASFPPVTVKDETPTSASQLRLVYESPGPVAKASQHRGNRS